MSESSSRRSNPSGEPIALELSKILSDRRERQIESLLIELDPERGLRVKMQAPTTGSSGDAGGKPREKGCEGGRRSG